MGQQQLILVILVTILVGTATVIAINIFGTSYDDSNVNAVKQDMITFASLAHSYFKKPEMLGGGGGDFGGLTFRSVDFPADQYDGSGATAMNVNGIYSLVVPTATDSSFVITAHPASRIDGVITLASTATEGGTILQARIGTRSIEWLDSD